MFFSDKMGYFLNCIQTKMVKNIYFKIYSVVTYI